MCLERTFEEQPEAKETILEWSGFAILRKGCHKQVPTVSGQIEMRKVHS